MRQQELDLFIELAPKLNEYRGEWQRGDEYFLQDEVGTPILHYIDTCDSCNFEVYECDAIWIPRAIDPADPERLERGEKPRGLWGMVDWSNTNCWMSCNILHIVLYSKASSSQDKILHGTPTEALLLALKAQWEDKV